LNEIRVGNDCLGLLIARETRFGRMADHDALLFHRGTDHLVLTGVGFRGEPVRDLLEYRIDATIGGWFSPDLSGSDSPVVMSR
jgi:hypothetical protein